MQKNHYFCSDNYYNYNSKQNAYEKDFYFIDDDPADIGGGMG